MNRVDPELVQQFVSALQLSITPRIARYVLENSRYPTSLSVESGRDALAVPPMLEPIAAASPHENAVVFGFADEESLKLATQFLLVTRLNPDIARKLASEDPRFEKFAGRQTTDSPRSTREAAAFVSEILARDKMTLRQLAEKTGLTQVTLSNFKRGKEIKLGNFLSICKALGITLRLEKKK